MCSTCKDLIPVSTNLALKLFWEYFSSQKDQNIIELMSQFKIKNSNVITDCELVIALLIEHINVFTDFCVNHFRFVSLFSYLAASYGLHESF
jgi:hypothetical protein